MIFNSQTLFSYEEYLENLEHIKDRNELPGLTDVQRYLVIQQTIVNKAVKECIHERFGEYGDKVCVINGVQNKYNPYMKAVKASLSQVILHCIDSQPFMDVWIDLEKNNQVLRIRTMFRDSFSDYNISILSEVGEKLFSDFHPSEDEDKNEKDFIWNILNTENTIDTIIIK